MQIPTDHFGVAAWLHLVAPGPWAFPHAFEATKKRADDRPKMAMGAFGKSVRAVLNVAGFFSWSDDLVDDNWLLVS
jgi:hypothetical protein